jgi:hypothetical protein
MEERYLDLTELSFVAAPANLPERFSSVALNDSELYPPEVIAEAFLAVPGTGLLHPAEPGWDEWRARWQEGSRYIEVDMMACQVEPELCGGYSLLWGGSGIKMHCLLSDLLAFWQRVRSRCPGVWLHDTETVMWSPETFAQEVAAFRAKTSDAEWRPGWGRM